MLRICFIVLCFIEYRHGELSWSPKGWDHHCPKDTLIGNKFLPNYDFKPSIIRPSAMIYICNCVWIEREWVWPQCLITGSLFCHSSRSDPEGKPSNRTIEGNMLRKTYDINTTRDLTTSANHTGTFKSHFQMS